MKKSVIIKVIVIILVLIIGTIFFYIKILDKTEDIDCKEFEIEPFIDQDMCVLIIAINKSKSEICKKAPDTDNCYYEFVRLIKQGYAESDEDLKKICRKIDNKEQELSCLNNLENVWGSGAMGVIGEDVVLGD